MRVSYDVYGVLANRLGKSGHSAHDPDWLGSDSARIAGNPTADSLPHSDPNRLQQACDALAKIRWLGDQAKHEMPLVGKIVEVSGMDAHLRLAQ